MTNIAGVVVQIICAPSILILIVALSKFRYSRRTTVIGAALLAALLMMIDFCVVLYAGHLAESYALIDFTYRVVNIIVATVLASFLIRQEVKMTVFVVLSVCVGTYIVDTAALTIRTLVGVFPLELAFELILYPIVVTLFIRVRKPLLRALEYVRSNLWPLCLVPGFLLATFLFQISIPDRLIDKPENITVALLLCCATVTVYVLYYYLFKAMHDKNMLEQNAMAMKLSVSSLENQNRRAALSEKHIGVFRHDLRHITNLMAGCLDTGDLNSARHLLTVLEKNIGDQPMPAAPLYTGNKLLDASLDYFSGLAKESGIAFKISVTKMDGVQADLAELAVVMANALENAVAACKNLSEETPREIRLYGYKRGKQYFLEIINTCDGNVTFDPETAMPVSNEEGHGVGSQSIAYFAEKNHAVLQYRLDGRLFHLRLLLKM